MRFALLEFFRSSLRDSEEAQNHLNVIQWNLSDLDRFTVEFRDSLGIFTLSRREAGKYITINHQYKSDVSNWEVLAAKIGAITLYNFYKTFEGIEKALVNIPGLRKEIDYKKLKEARHHFEQYFPNLQYLRHAAAHAGERSSTSEKVKRHLFQGPFKSDSVQLSPESKNIFLYSIEGDKIIETYEGKIIHYELNIRSLSDLEKTRDIFHDIFGGFAGLGPIKVPNTTSMPD